MLVINRKINCYCNKCREHITTGGYKYTQRKGKALCFNCGKPDNLVLRWGFNRVKEMNNEYAKIQ